MVKARKTPLRTCIGCGTGSDKKALVRIVRTPEGDVTVDPTGKANGRGAYICASTDCFDAALRRRRLDSALRVRLNEEELDRLRREFDSAVAAVSQGR
ncbi:MAG: RNase P modulator RnpM [Coriobacteriia bacterium]